MKHTRGKDRWQCRELREHQRNALRACQTDTGFTFKLPDLGFSHLPFDCIFYRNSPAYVIIGFPTRFYIVLIDKLVAHKTGSLTESQVAGKAEFVVSNRELA